VIYAESKHAVTVRITGNNSEFQGAKINDKNTILLPRQEKDVLWERSDYPGTKRNYYASVKTNTTKILLFSNILKQINSTKEDSIRFWKSIGFSPNGKDEYDISLFIKKAGSY